MPVGIGQMDDHRHENGEGLALIVFQDAQEKVVFEETHRAVGDLEMGARDALNQPLEQLVDVGLEFRDIADVEHLEQLLQELGLLSAVGEGPIFQQSIYKLRVRA